MLPVSAARGGQALMREYPAFCEGGDFTGETAVSVFRNVSGKAIFSEMRTLRDLERERMGEWASAKLIEGAD